MKTYSYDEDDVRAFAEVLLTSPDMDTMPPEADEASRQAVRRMCVKHGLPARLVLAFAAATERGACNCGTCLVLRLHPDAKHPDPPENGLLYAALALLAATRGPQKGPVCEALEPEEVH